MTAEPLVTVQGAGLPVVVLRPGETLLFGRAPQASPAPGRVVLALPDCAPHVSRDLGELVVGTGTVTLRWLGAGEAQLSSLFDAPGGARRVTMTRSMTALLDDGENQLMVLLGRQDPDGRLTDRLLAIDIVRPRPDEPGRPAAPGGSDATTEGPRLERFGRDWFVALALTEPWLTGQDDYPRPPSNREIHERILHWRGHAWNLHRPQRVDEAIRTISALAFGVRNDPYGSEHPGRLQNVRFMVARRAAELRLVTQADLAEVERAARDRDPSP
ncbi:hypothetical protein [Kutzneria buriramensis]|uniref:Uncharacterized protein n=1 Tax=Kutzneria buriramensis TaxID=1045776 RepID=A0A3E0GYB2_9PSEU|nr:hypothetical protein [Kutzneria buriramensis]REH34771.1 hypothetical protein BCF44_11947 [Kutzneria buriramensis]